MELLLTWTILAFIIEKTVEVLVAIVPALENLDERYPSVKIKMLISLVLGLLLAYGAGLDFFAMFDIEFTLPYVGIVLSALLMSAGSSFVHEIKERIKG